MTFEQFKYVLEVAKTKSINQAAKNLYVSQSALSNSIIKLESELNKQIFIRNNQGVSLTSFGNDFVSYIIPIYDQIMQLNHLLIKNTTSNYSDFSVSSNGFRFVSNICSDMYKLNRLSGIHIHQFDGLGDETIDYVANGQVDLGVFRIWDCYKKFYMQQFKTKKFSSFLCLN